MEQTRIMALIVFFGLLISNYFICGDMWEFINGLSGYGTIALWMMKINLIIIILGSQFGIPLMIGMGKKINLWNAVTGYTAGFVAIIFIMVVSIVIWPMSEIFLSDHPSNLLIFQLFVALLCIIFTIVFPLMVMFSNKEWNWA